MLKKNVDQRGGERQEIGEMQNQVRKMFWVAEKIQKI